MPTTTNVDSVSADDSGEKQPVPGTETEGKPKKQRVGSSQVAIKSRSNPTAAKKRDAVGADNPSPLPKPPGVQIRDPDKFFKYWSATHKKHPDRLVAYFYRKWPVLDRARLDKPKYIAKHYAPVSEDQIYMMLGEGDYKIILHDDLIHRQVCYTMLKGFRDHDYPAVVDLEDIVMDDPQNQSWIERMRSRGVHFPGDIDMEKSSDSEALSQLAQTVERLAMQQYERVPDPSPMETGLGATMLDTVAHASRMGNEILKSAFDRAEEVRAKQESTSPTTQLKEVVEAVKAIMPQPQTQQPAGVSSPPGQDPTKIFQLILESNQSSHEAQLRVYSDQVELMRRELEEMRKERLELIKPREDQIDPFKQATKVLELQQKLAESNPASPESNAPWWAQALISALPMGLQLASQAASMFAAGTYNRAVEKTGAGTPISPRDIQAAQAAQAAQAGQVQSGASGGTGTIGSAGGPSGGPDTYQSFLAGISEPLITHLTDPDLTGADFADWLVRSQPNGHLIYLSLREQGKDQILRLIQTYEPLWGRLRSIPQEFDRFLDEFLSYSEAMDTEEPVPDAEPELDMEPAIEPAMEPATKDTEPVANISPAPARGKGVRGRKNRETA